MLRVLRFIEDDLSGLLLAAMTVVMSAEVFARYVLGHSITWASEVATICFVWQVYLASIGVMRRRLHVSVDILRKPLAGRRLAQFDTFSGLIVVATLSLTGWQAWEFVTETHFSPLPATGLSRQVLANAVLAGCGGMLAHALLHLSLAVRGIVTGDYNLPAVEPLTARDLAAGEGDRR